MNFLSSIVFWDLLFYLHGEMQNKITITTYSLKNYFKYTYYKIEPAKALPRAIFRRGPE